MKCIRCGTDNSLKDRTSNYGRCKNCQHPFVFEPTSMQAVKITDPLFARAIADLSANNTLFFTPRQLFYLLENRVRSKSGLTTGWALFLLFFFNLWAPGFIGGFLGALTGSTMPTLIVSILVNVIFVVVLVRASQSSKGNPQSRRRNARSLQLGGWGILLVGSSVSLFVLQSFPLFCAAVILGVLAIYLGSRQLRRQAAISQTPFIRQDEFQGWITSWERINRSIEKLLPAPQESLPPVELSPDITAYSFDRLVVTDSAAIAQLLIANNFHFEHNCAILSITGYPQNIFSTTMEMLRRNPDLKVFAFHDCSPTGVSLVYHLRTSAAWFQNSPLEIFDVGLLPRQIGSIQNAFVQTSQDSANAAKQLPNTVRQELTTEELAWLDAGNLVELESFTPQRLLQVLHRGVMGSRDFAAGDDGTLVFLGDGGSYAFDSFG